MAAGSPPSARTLAVWSPAVRLLHWTLAASMIVGFATHESVDALHEWAGYVALAAASARVLLGLIGTGRWRFAQFVRGPAETLAYARAVLARREPHFLGHNPLGGWMVLLLLADTLATGITGWLYTTDRFWGLEWMEDLHGAFGKAILPLLLLHVAGVVFTSIRQRENLVRAMLDGRKQPRDNADRP